MSNPNQKFIDSWEKTKAKGILRYVLRTGLFFGGMMFLFSSLMELSDNSFSVAFLSQKAAIRLLTCLGMGILVLGPGSWAINHFSYKKMLESGK